MSRKFQLQIPEPCHESWDKMKPAEHGRFCNSCQKAVVDFTAMSDPQLIAFFKKPTRGSVCGRFNDDQLQRDIVIPGKRMPWLKYFLQLLLPTFLFACKARTQGTPRLLGDTIYVDTNKVMKEKDSRIKEVPIDSNKLKGRVTDQNGCGIPHASVVIKGARRGVMANASGYYEIDISGLDPKQRLVFSSIGFSDAERSIKSLQQQMDCVLQLSTMPMGVVVISHPGKGKIGRRSNLK